MSRPEDTRVESTTYVRETGGTANAVRRDMNYIIYTPKGFLADWSHAAGQPTYTTNADDAALFNAYHARNVWGILHNGCVLEAASRRLLTLAELEQA